MRRPLLATATALLLAASAAFTSHRAAVRVEEEAAVRAALEHYLAGHASGDGSHYAAAMHPEGRMLFVREGKLQTRSFPDYIAGASGKPASDEAQRRRRIVSVDLTGNAAMGKIELDYPGVTLTDYMALLKIEGEWKIVAKIFDSAPKK